MQASSLVRGAALFAAGAVVTGIAMTLLDHRSSTGDCGTSTVEPPDEWDLRDFERNVSSAAPSSWSASDRSRVATAAYSVDADSLDIRDAISNVTSNAPSAWSGSDQARVAAAAIRADSDSWDIRDAISDVRSAVPSSWPTWGAAMVAAAALRHDADRWDIQDAVRDADNPEQAAAFLGGE